MSGARRGNQFVLNKRKEGNELDAELTRAEIIKCIQYNKVKFRGINFSGLDLSKLASLLGLKLSNLEGFLLLSYVYSWQICLSKLSQSIHLFCWNLFLEKVLLMSIDDCDLVLFSSSKTVIGTTCEGKKMQNASLFGFKWL